MSKNVKLNGKDYLGVSTIQVPTTSGGVASFKDVDEIVNVPTSGGTMESGIFVGNDAMSIEIPVTSKKSHIAIWTTEASALAVGKMFTNISCLAIEGVGLTYASVNPNGTDSMGYAFDEDQYTEESATKPLYCIFTDNAVKVAQTSYNTNQIYSSQLTYNWVAW